MRRHRRWLLGLVIVLATLVVGMPAAHAETFDRLPEQSGWLQTLNYMRSVANLHSVSENTTFRTGLQNHVTYLRDTPDSCYTEQYASRHRENPGCPLYTPSGDTSGQRSNLAFGTQSERDAIELWMTGPFHAIGMLRPHLQQVAFAREPTRGIAGLDITSDLIVNNRQAPSPPQQILFPGADSVVHLQAFRTENPNPLETCGYAGSGLPIIAMLDTTPSPATTATLTNGYGGAVEACVVTEHNYVTSDPVYGAAGKSILRGARGVLVIPKAPLHSDRYTVTIRQPGDDDVQWSFLTSGLQRTKVAANGLARIHVADGPTTVLGNLTVTGPEGAGWTTAYPCASGRPLASNNNYVTCETIPNFAVVRADANGDICVHTIAATHVLWDQVASTSAFTSTAPTRVFDSRNSGKIPADGVARIHVAPGATTVMGNLTVTGPEASGWTTAYPCASERPLASTNNYVRGQTIPNFAVVQADASGEICVHTTAATHLVWDQVAATTAVGASAPTRVFDSRNSGKIPADGVARIHVSDQGGVTVLGNLTVTGPEGSGWTTAYPCAGGRPLASNNNYVAGQTIPNFAVVRADASGDICVHTTAATHLVWDQVAATTAVGASAPDRVFDSRVD